MMYQSKWHANVRWIVLASMFLSGWAAADEIMPADQFSAAQSMAGNVGIVVNSGNSMLGDDAVFASEVASSDPVMISAFVSDDAMQIRAAYNVVAYDTVKVPEPDSLILLCTGLLLLGWSRRKNQARRQRVAS